MNKWWNWVLGVALFCLLFVAIPISYSGRSKEQMKPVFDEYIEKFNKSYKNNPDEYELRFQHFLASMQEIDRLNSESRGPEDYRARYGPTKLSDMSAVEYKELHLSDERLVKAPNLYGRSWRKHNERDLYHVEQPHENDRDKKTRNRRATLPLQVDWRVKGAVGAVRNQGMCGACWAFSTIGTMESMAAINTGKVPTLSVQEVIDCATLGNQGCAGGDICLLLDWLLITKTPVEVEKEYPLQLTNGACRAKKNATGVRVSSFTCDDIGNQGCAGGDICLLLDWLLITKTPVEVEKEYPLQLTNGACRAKKNATGVRVSSFTCDDFVGAEQKILEALALHGPVAVAVNAVTWQNYLGGVIQYHCSGAAIDLNHAVQLVGYDLSAEVPYFIAKNSWGTDFGLNGYVHLAIGNNICGLANEVATIEVA